MGVKAAFFILTSALFSVFLFVLFAPPDSKAPPQMVDVPKGASFNRLAEELKERGLIRSAAAFKALIKIFRAPPLFIGEYRLSPGASLWTQFQTLRKGESYQASITFPEGLNHYEMFLLLKSKGYQEAERFLQLARDSSFAQSLMKEPLNSLEGYLFPETYLIGKYLPAAALLKQMTQRFLTVYVRLIQQDSAALIDFSRHAVVTLASLIEKETGSEGERRRISSVFHNRLKKGMKLQADPTILYSLFLTEGFDRALKIGKKDILHPSPYNTYFIKGLPPGPVASPGEKSLKAALLPLSTKDLYFVSRNDGTHVFSQTLKEHTKAVYKYQIKPFQKMKEKKSSRKH